MTRANYALELPLNLTDEQIREKTTFAMDVVDELSAADIKLFASDFDGTFLKRHSCHDDRVLALFKASGHSSFGGRFLGTQAEALSLFADPELFRQMLIQLKEKKIPFSIASKQSYIAIKTLIDKAFGEGFSDEYITGGIHGNPYVTGLSDEGRTDESSIKSNLEKKGNGGNKFSFLTSVATEMNLEPQQIAYADDAEAKTSKGLIDLKTAKNALIYGGPGELPPIEGFRDFAKEFLLDNEEFPSGWGFNDGGVIIFEDVALEETVRTAYHYHLDELAKTAGMTMDNFQNFRAQLQIRAGGIEKILYRSKAELKDPFYVNFTQPHKSQSLENLDSQSLYGNWESTIYNRVPEKALPKEFFPKVTERQERPRGSLKKESTTPPPLPLPRQIDATAANKALVQDTASPQLNNLVRKATDAKKALWDSLRALNTKRESPLSPFTNKAREKTAVATAQGQLTDVIETAISIKGAIQPAHQKLWSNVKSVLIDAAFTDLSSNAYLEKDATEATGTDGKTLQARGLDNIIKIVTELLDEKDGALFGEVTKKIEESPISVEKKIVLQDMVSKKTTPLQSNDSGNFMLSRSLGSDHNDESGYISGGFPAEVFANPFSGEGPQNNPADDGWLYDPEASLVILGATTVEEDPLPLLPPPPPPSSTRSPNGSRLNVPMRGAATTVQKHEI